AQNKSQSRIVHASACLDNPDLLKGEPMDPQAAWDRLLAAYAAGDWDQIEELATDLLAWLNRDGFPPTVIRQSDLDADWRGRSSGLVGSCPGEMEHPDMKSTDAFHDGGMTYQVNLFGPADGMPRRCD